MGIQADNIFALCRMNSDIYTMGNGAFFICQHMDVVILFLIFHNDLFGTIIGRGNGKENFQPVFWIILTENGIQTGTDIVVFISYRNDNRHKRGGAVGTYRIVFYHSSLL